MRCKRRRCLRVLCLLLIGAAVLMYLRIRPMLQTLAVAGVENRASNLINDSIEWQMKHGDVEYDNLVLLEKDINGSITALKTNMAAVNRLKTQVLSVVDNKLLELDINEIGLPIGSLLLPELLSGLGPKLPVKVLSISNSDAVYRNEFSGAGINQTAHRIMMDVCIDMTVLTPVGTQSLSVSSSVVVAETVIVGQVPQSYVNVE